MDQDRPTREDHILCVYICVYAVQDALIIEAQSFPELLHKLVALSSRDNIWEVATIDKMCALSDDVSDTIQIVLEGVRVGRGG